MNSKKNAKYKCYFEEIWLDDPELSSCLKKHKSETGFLSIMPEIVFCSKSRKESVTLYASGEKHKSRMPSNTQSTLTPFAAASKAKDSKTDGQKESEQSSSSPVKDYFTSEALADAEILWVLDVIANKYSLNSCRNKNELFSKMFKDSRIAQSFAVGSTKCSYMINFGLAPYFESLLEESLNRKVLITYVVSKKVITVQSKRDKWIFMCVFEKIQQTLCQPGIMTLNFYRRLLPSTCMKNLSPVRKV